MTQLGKQKFAVGLILIGCVSVLALAFKLDPDPRGIGTHQQIHLPAIGGVTIHLPPCALQSLTGIPCATCGMTTCFAHAAKGQFERAFLTQPFGLVLFFLTVGVAIDSAVFLATNRTIRHVTLPWKKIIFWLAVLWALAWAYKIWVTVHQPKM